MHPKGATPKPETVAYGGRGLCMRDYMRHSRHGTLDQYDIVLVVGPQSEHGTYSRYNYGCRCAACRDANATRQLKHSRAARNKGLPPGDPRHGTDNGYVYYGCRCGECAAAHRSRMREGYASRLARGLAEGDRRHGTKTGYSAWGCRCDACKAAYRARQRAGERA